ncbi:MAG: porin [Pseudomonadota bacterium]
MQHKKALIAAAVAAGLAASANAAAEVTVYGKIHTSFAAVSEDTGATDTSSTEVKSNASRIGFKSAKAMQNGMTIKGQAEFQIDYAGDASKSSDDLIKLRNTYVGLKGGFGEVRIGRHDTPHKMSTGKLDPFGDTYADYNNIIQNDNRVSNAIAYINSFGPVGIGLAYAAGEDAVDEENNNDATSMMVNYSAGPLYLSAALESFSDDTDPAETDELETATKLGAGYKVGPVALGLVYETLAYETRDDETETYVSMKFKANDAMAIKAAYGMRDDGVSGTDDATMTAVGVDYKMDKQASVYALYANGADGGLANKGKLAGDGSALSLGVVYKF